MAVMALGIGCGLSISPVRIMLHLFTVPRSLAWPPRHFCLGLVVEPLGLPRNLTMSPPKGLDLTSLNHLVATLMVRLVFRPYTQIRRSICTSEPLRASTRVSSGFTLFRHSSPSFGSQQLCSYSDPSVNPWTGRRCTL